MKTASKIAAKDSCNFALNKGNSNETNIKVTPEIAALFGKVPNSGESFDVSFYIEKGDFKSWVLYLYIIIKANS